MNLGCCLCETDLEDSCCSDGYALHKKETGNAFYVVPSQTVMFSLQSA